MTTGIQRITPTLFRVFVASVWYDTTGVRSPLYCKAREVISGDRAERIAQEYIGSQLEPAKQGDQ